MKKVLLLAIALLSLLAASAAFAATPYDSLSPVELRFGNGAALGAAGDVWGDVFCKKIAEITGGKLTVQYLNNSTVGNDAEMQTQLLAGDLDIVACQPAQTTNFVPAVSFYDLPLVFAGKSAAKIQSALTNSKFSEMLNAKYGEVGMLCLDVLQNATFRVMTSNKEIKSVGDFAGIKIRTMPNPNHLAFWQALGANPTPLPFPELYMSLQQGVVDAQENANDTNLSSNFQEVQKYLVNVQAILYANQFLVNKEKFESLDPAYQAAIREALAAATAEIAPTLTKLNDDCRDKLVAGGMKDLTFDAAFYDEVIKKSDGVYKEIRSKIGDDLVDALIAALK